MKCSGCGTDAGGTPPGRAVRCLNCGRLLNPARPGEQAAPATAASRHSYTTPFGKILAQAQKAGNWVAVSYVAVPDASKPAAARLIANLLASWRELNHPFLAKTHSFDDKELRCTWVLPRVADAAPLTASASLSPADVMALVRALAGQLEQLHQAGLGAFDLSPSVVFLPPQVEQASFVPTPWLASQALWSPGGVKDMPFVAPELDQGRQVYPDPVRADLYALGALAWFLLTGQDRRKSPATLPGEHSPELAVWDQFIDGCCRSNPARRFDSVAAAMKSLEEGRHLQQERIPPRASTSATVTTARATAQADLKTDPVAPPSDNSGATPRKSRRRLVGVAVLALGVFLALAVYLRREQLASVFPSLSGVLVSYQRGFGDTVLRYADRSYENAAWKKLKEADSLSEFARRNNSGDTVVRLRRVAGWDDENFWVTGDCFSDGLVFRCRNGHWSLQARLEEAGHPVARPLDDDALFVASGIDWSREPKLYLLSPRGLASFGTLNACKEICPVAPDLVYFYRYRSTSFLKVAGGERTLMEADKYKEAYVHREDNTPLKDYPVTEIRHTRTPAPGKAIGVAPPAFSGDRKVVSFRDGVWYALADIPNKEINDAWLCGPGSTRSLIVVGENGFVLAHSLGGANAELPLPPSQETTSSDLIKVWGVSPEKFWAMDKSGTVWERRGAEWRVVVRGLYRDDVKFDDAWVSPRGNVIAVTEKHVYRLE